MIRGFAVILLVVIVGACSSSREDRAAQALAPAEASGPSIRDVPSLKINEVMVLNTRFAGDDGTHRPWIEVLNDGNTEIRLYDYVLKTDQDTWQMPDVSLEPGGLHILQSLENLDGSGEEFLAAGVNAVGLMIKSSQLLVDSVTVPATSPDESVARYPNGTGRFFVYPAAQASFRQMNPDAGFINKLASTTEFKPRDTSSNAILRHDGAFWILGGWSNFGHDSWYSYTDVWRSADGVKWEPVNSAPPYIHYCSFAVWKGRMWAIGPSSFSSTDGIEWRPEAIQSPALNRSVVFNDALISIHGSTVMATQDGAGWTTLTDSAPWGMLRQQPSVLVYRGRIWVIGGVSDYGTPNETLHNDVWASSDGVSWESIATSSRWAPRIWASAAVHDGRIFLLNGANRNLWPEENGNSSEIWFTDNGIDWFELKSESAWGARHAAFSVADDQGGLLLLAGYGHGGTARIYNDVWTLHVSMYFSKPSGPLHKLGTWGKNKDGSGRSPASFSDENQIFILRNRASFTADDRWSVSGARSRIFVGDGDSDTNVRLVIANQSPAAQPLYLYSNSTTVVRGSSPSVLLRDPAATLVFE